MKILFSALTLTLALASCATINHGGACWAMAAKRSTVAVFASNYPGNYSTAESAKVYLSSDIDRDCAPQPGHVAACNINGDLWIGTSYYRKVAGVYKSLATTSKELVELVCHEVLHTLYLLGTGNKNFNHSGTWAPILDAAQKTAVTTANQCEGK